MSSDEIQRWLEQGYGRRARAWRGIRAFYYNKCPSIFRFRWLGLTHGSLKASLATSGPVVAWYLGEMSLATAGGIGGALFAANALVSMLDKSSAAKPLEGQRMESFVRFGDLLAALKADSVEELDKQKAIRACLGIIENICLPITKSRKGEISANLILYRGNSSTKMKVIERNPGNERPVGREVNGENMLGHHACRHDGLPRVVDDLRSFSSKWVSSPTQSRAGYRSIFFIPLAQKRSGRTVVRGFISIDCQRPFAFHGNRSRDIIVTCEPVTSLIIDLI